MALFDRYCAVQAPCHRLPVSSICTTVHIWSIGFSKALVVRPCIHSVLYVCRSRTELDPNLTEWLEECQAHFDALFKQLFVQHQQRCKSHTICLKRHCWCIISLQHFCPQLGLHCLIIDWVTLEPTTPCLATCCG